MADRRLRIHVLIDSLTWGGAETLLADFATGARDAGIEVSVAHLGIASGAAERLRSTGVVPIHVPTASLLGRRDRLRVREHLAEVSPDILHTHLGYADLLGGAAARHLDIPAVSTIHVMEWSGGPREQLKLQLMARARRRCSARVITVSETARRNYLARGWDRPGHVVAVHNGIVDGCRRGAGPGIRRELGVGPDEVLVAMVTVLRTGKGHEVAAEAVQRLTPEFPNLRLLVLGEGPDRGEVERALENLGARAIMTGHREDVLAVLDAVDVLIHPTRADAFPTALLESMAASVPAIATSVGGIPEIITDGETGLLIDSPPDGRALAESLAVLLRDARARERIGSAARERFEAKFTVDAWLSRLLPIYDLALAGAG